MRSFKASIASPFFPRSYGVDFQSCFVGGGYCLMALDLRRSIAQRYFGRNILTEKFLRYYFSASLFLSQRMSSIAARALPLTKSNALPPPEIGVKRWLDAGCAMELPAFVVLNPPLARRVTIKSTACSPRATLV